jgi:23S rRNA (guanosine2251-2'-O)-methyltransferase
MHEWIYGRNPVYETLRSGRRQAFRLLVAEGSLQKGRLDEIVQLSISKKIPLELPPRSRLDAIAPGHQGVALEASGYPYVGLPDILELAGERGEPPFILLLDALQDPQNLGTLLRTAEAVGVHGAVIPLRHTAEVTPAVVSASSGACEHLLIVQANLAQAIAQLKEIGVWVVGLESDPHPALPDQLRLDGALALVVGSEGQGLRPLVRDSCDVLLRLPMRGRVASLNAAVAGSVALYMAWEARGYSLDQE